ncbi:dTDP-4-dehydrorhamnose reductase [Lacticaseibacillus rhamnosus]|uniref:dTDP-4-dehydrorhamnose reductase n=1 Tax=Lacticaseibacillus rhamnosus TaxID=47715 RepID=UPI0007DFC591|nr:dTDP-4-dehydrorhamnose reductase [Lacticaseibacillus rhamnosus]MCZ2733703.1 dTDP-4-dehydrorhamnose reductase [Lacticaseibacillus rhamnosus]MCZ2736383.1 dTDP-4-dehydrorhamnose reductase [Lacticaseibacillus rhamnosus]MCZ2742717.1 dTDP-4-dehydrorhamnose reductase [Lacticaseibacillus rhamnosus]MCZ2745463.1 dTDP-4-dehydrorhamnose reductase [Lacticaseibacillus rhamnosus]MCZ2748180.1 dTDP-4-dehydrorhamnose reductase [Lacticaseibacillus rhamnosus]
MKILITGAQGQLGTELRHLLDARGITYRATDAKDLDITNEAAVNQYFADYQPDLVYHCAAYTAVDKAEDEAKALNQLVNVDGTRNLAKAAAKVDATLVYISTDYVFDGDSKEIYTVDDQPAPRNEYGRAKYEGEQQVQKYLKKYYIIRTSWVFGEYGHNFVYTMLNLAKTHQELTVVDDQYGRPSWTKTLAEFMTFAVDQHLDYGIYHLSNDNSCNWYEFASAILADKDVTVKPVSSAEYPQKAWRPRHSILDLSKTKATGFKIPTWQDALKDFLKIVDK